METRRDDVRGVLAALFLRRRDVDADIVRRIAGRQPIARWNVLQDGGEGVTELFADFRQMRVVKHEPQVLLHHPQPFRGAVGVGVQYPQGSHPVGGVEIDVRRLGQGIASQRGLAAAT
jgi:hypothetical protein